MQQESGNYYDLVTTDAGIPTFRHVSTGETLHAQVGPWQEAFSLYIEPSGLLRCEGCVTVYDVGLGCASLLLASLFAWRTNFKLQVCNVVSFDLEKLGLQGLLDHLSKFPFAESEKDTIQKFLENDHVVLEENGRRFEWRFVRGNFRDTITSSENFQMPPADHVFYDLFSPASLPHVWTYEVFSHLFRHCSSRARLYTYCCSTRARAALLAAGFFVGLGIPSGKKSKTTIAACRLSDLSEPLPPTWVDTFKRSHIPFLSAERPELHEEIRMRVYSHPQFATNR